MADMTQALTVMERQRQALVDAYVQRAWNMWKSLDPADWWNDAITQGVSAWITQNQIAFIKAMRHLGVSYADVMLGMVNVPSDGQIPEYIVTRDNTDPWAVSVRPADAYRSMAVRDPSIRPLAWDNLDDYVQKAVDDWLDAAVKRLTDNANTDGQIAMNSAATQRFHGSGVRNTVGSYTPSFPRPARAACAPSRPRTCFPRPTFCPCTTTANAPSPRSPRTMIPV